MNTDIFKNYVSATLASNGNQTFFFPENESEILTGMVFIKIYKGGKFNFIFSYSGVIDSTFADGNVSRCNDICKGWKIHSLRAAAADSCDPDIAEKLNFKTVTFNGKSSVTVDKDLIFSDPVEINAEKDSYICLKTEFSGYCVPHHEESIIVLFRKNNNWEASSKVPVPVFTGIDRTVRKRIAFIGDSITQGIGSDFNSYKHYAACTAVLLGGENSYWDLGLGFARGSDAASDGIWLEKAKQNDIISVCFGVNDILKNHTEEELKKDLKTIVEKLKKAGLKVIIQTVPPFDYDSRNAEIWRNVNKYIRTELSETADAVFDNNPILCEDGKDSPKAKYGGHPNNTGHRLWAEALAECIKNII